EEAAKQLHQGFLSRVQRQRPHLALKLATSLDGAMAAANGSSRWITGEEARRFVHRLRAEYDAIITGSGTLLADDPLLTCRLPGIEHRSPIWILLDRSLRLTAAHRLCQTVRDAPLWIATAAETLESHPEHIAAFKACGIEIIP